MVNEEENHALVADDEAPTKFALMAKSSSSSENEVFDDSFCSKSCRKNTDSLKTKIGKLNEELSDSENTLYHYKLGLSQVEARLAEFKTQEIKFCEKIRGLEFDVESKNSKIERLMNELEQVKKEKEGLDSKLTGFESASKDLDTLLGSQRSDKNKEGLGYSVVPPPPAQVYSPPKKDMSWTGLPEFADDTITDYSRPSPSIESNSNDLQNSNSSVSEPGESSSTILSKPMIKFVKAADSLTDIKTNKVETVRKSSVRYAEMYRNTSKSPKVRGNQRNWNNLKTQQLGKDIMMKNKACFKCGHFDHQAYDCGYMTSNISCLSDYEPYDGGYVSFGQGGGKITSKGIIKTSKLEFENVYFVKDLKYNLFSVSQICDNKNSVLFTDSECIVLRRDFKLKDDTNVLLRTPRQHNMYSIDLNNIVPHKDLTCLVAKAFADESMLWHRRLGHLNFKTMNKLVRHNLVKGLPSKCFENDHTCVACLKGKQHKASCKTKLVNSVSKPLYTLHIDLFGPTSVSSLNHNWYCLVVTDDFSRFTWTFFLKTKDETSGILRNFITEIENLKELKVDVIAWWIDSGAMTHVCKDREEGQVVQRMRKSRHVTIVHQTKDLHTADYIQLYDFLKYNQKEVDELKAKRIAKTQDPPVLMANSNNPYVFLTPHQDQSSFNQNYLQQPMPNPKDITDPTTAMNMALALMAKAFKLNYSTPTNNNQRILSNPRNRQIVQLGMNMGQDRHMQMVGGNVGNQFRQYVGQNAGNPAGYNDVIGNQNQIGNGNLVAARANGNATGQNGNQIRCYNCKGVEEYDLMAAAADFDEIKEVNANCILMANLQQASTSGIQLQAEEFDLVAAAAYHDEIEEVNANCILMANLQQPSTSGTQTDIAPVYDSDGSAEVIQICLWCVDSGFSKHMTGNLKLLINFVWKFLRTVCFGNDHVAAIMGFGDLQWGNILITRAYFVEVLGHNLFSVGQLCDSDLEDAFRRNAFFVRNLEGVDLLKKDRSTNLYTINLHEMASASPICLMARASSTKSWLWHQRLSHLNFDTIIDLAKNDLVACLPKFNYHKEHLCPSCEQGKAKEYLIHQNQFQIRGRDYIFFI
nr:ribonuclease H-like domain-containing protein [Tanacetum cinerariifolium]